jgi:hypothetical protein
MKSLAALLVVALVPVANAQQLPPTAESTVARAIKLAADHDTTGARHVLDSLVSKGESPLVRGEAMYQLAQITSSAADREAALASLVVDYPFSPRLAPALLQLGTLELARNDRDRAAVHLARYLTASTRPDTGRLGASLTLGRLLVERGELPAGCAALLIGRSELPETALELRTQFDFSIGRCQGVDTTTKLETKPAADSAPAPRRTGAFTVQVAAYDTKRAADRAATALRAQGLDARVVGTEKPFRLRVGRYATRTEAEEASRRIDTIAKSSSIVVVVGPEEK